MTNKQLINKMKNNMKMRNFSHYTYDSYLGQTKDIMKYFGEKKLEDVTTEELNCAKENGITVKEYPVMPVGFSYKEGTVDSRICNTK